MGLRTGAVAAALCSLLAASVAAAQAPLAGPDEVVIHLYSSLTSSDFAEGLACELGRVLSAPVSMAFPRDLRELDAKSAEFCADDRSALVGAGILKARPVGACNIVAMAGR